MKISKIYEKLVISFEEKSDENTCKMIQKLKIHGDNLYKNFIKQKNTTQKFSEFSYIGYR